MRSLILLLTFWLSASCVRADGGTPRALERRDGILIAVFTSPTPPRVGAVDVSVLVQDERTGTPRLDAPVSVVGYPVDAPGRLRTGLVVSATNRLMHSAMLPVDRAGLWRVEVTATGAPPVRFDLVVDGAPPPWVDMAGWIVWPALAVGIYSIHQRRRGRLAR